MKISHLSSMHEWNDDRIFQRNCIGLAKKNIDVSYVVSYDKEKDFINGVEIVGIKKRKGIKRRIFSSYEVYKKGLMINADIYHFHDPDLIPFMYLYLFKGKKVIFDIHENYLSRIDSAIKLKLIKKFLFKIWRGIEINFIKKSNSGIVTTDTMKTLYEKANTDILTVSNTVYLDALKDIELDGIKKNNQFTVFVSGTHSKQRNCENIVNAFKIVVKRFPDVKLIFIGRYHPVSFKNKLSELIKNLGLTENVFLNDMVPWEENFKRLSTGHIGLVFYEDNLNNRVTIPNRLFEYMYCNLAVIGDAYPEIINIIKETKCGLIADSNNIKTISEKIIYLIENPDIMQIMSENGKKAVMNKYNYEFILENLINYYNKLLKK